MSRVTTYLTGLLLLYTVEAALSQSIRLQQLQLDDHVLTKRLTSFTSKFFLYGEGWPHQAKHGHVLVKLISPIPKYSFSITG